MERSAYHLLGSIESSWWYRGRSAAIHAALSHLKIRRAENVLDYGAGLGGMLPTLERYSQSIDAVEPDEFAHSAARNRNYRTVFRKEEEYASEKYELVGLFDVLEHIEHDRVFLSRLKQNISGGGRVVITVPAFPFLWSAHDIEHHHHRRYTPSSLRTVLQDAGYEIDYIRFWNCSLFIPAAIMRLVGKGGKGGLAPPGPINTFLSLIVLCEAAVSRVIPLPFGLSLIAVARPRIDLTRDSSRPGVLKYAQFLMRYGIAGVIGGITQTATLFIWVSMLGFEDLYLAGLIIGFVLALIISFLLQKYWTFRDSARVRTRRQLLSYTTVAILGLCLNAGLLMFAKALFEATSANFFAGWYLLAQVIIVAIVSVFNFGLNFLITFNHARRKRLWSR